MKLLIVGSRGTKYTIDYINKAGKRATVITCGVKSENYIEIR